MYFSAKLSIDPSQLTKIEREEPDQTFRKILHFITGGASSKKVEKETFAAVSVLQQLHRFFWEMGIDNIIRLSHDDIDIYFDNEGKENDLKEALDKYELTINDAMSHHFSTIHLVLEHEDENFVYLIEIDINRSHAVGAYPIIIKVNGLIKDFRAGKDMDEEHVKAKMNVHFESQETMNRFVNNKHYSFETMVNEMALNVRKYMKVDDVKVEVEKRLVMPKKKGARLKPIKRAQHEYDPVFGGYFGFGELMLYGFLWSELLHDHSMHIDNVTLIGEDADVLGDIGAEGLDAGTADLFNEELDFDSRLGDFGDAGTDMTDMVADVGGDSDSWFDFGDAGDFGDVGGFDF